MSIAWTTVAIILLLTPGLFFFIGVATYERLSREIIRTSVISEVALATMIAIGLHTISIIILSAFGFRLSQFIGHLIEYAEAGEAVLLPMAASRLFPIVIYLFLTALFGFLLGCLVAVGVVRGPLRFLAMHKWIYDVIDSGRKGGIVTAYVMTNIKEDGRVLMYRGRIHEFFLTTEGKISYLILKNCAKFYMTFGSEGLTTSKQMELFSDQTIRIWDYLQIEGSNIANILFDPSSDNVKQTNEGTEALLAEVKARLAQRDQVRERIRKRMREQRYRTNLAPGSDE